MAIYLHVLPPMIWENAGMFMTVSNMLEMDRLEAKNKSTANKAAALEASSGRIRGMMQHRVGLK